MGLDPEHVQSLIDQFKNRGQSMNPMDQMMQVMVMKMMQKMADGEDVGKAGTSFDLGQMMQFQMVMQMMKPEAQKTNIMDMILQLKMVESLGKDDDGLLETLIANISKGDEKETSLVQQLLLKDQESHSSDLKALIAAQSEQTNLLQQQLLATQQENQNNMALLAQAIANIQAGAGGNPQDAASLPLGTARTLGTQLTEMGVIQSQPPANPEWEKDRLKLEGELDNIRTQNQLNSEMIRDVSGEARDTMKDIRSLIKTVVEYQLSGGQGVAPSPAALQAAQNHPQNTANEFYASLMAKVTRGDITKDQADAIAEAFDKQFIGG